MRSRYLISYLSKQFPTKPHLTCSSILIQKSMKYTYAFAPTNAQLSPQVAPLSPKRHANFSNLKPSDIHISHLMTTEDIIRSLPSISPIRILVRRSFRRRINFLSHNWFCCGGNFLRSQRTSRISSPGRNRSAITFRRRFRQAFW